MINVKLMIEYVGFVIHKVKLRSDHCVLIDY